jgi:hypothetical protein
MLHKGRIEIQGKGPFGVFFWSEEREPWTTKKVSFYETEDTIMFLIDPLLLHPQEACRIVLDAIANGRGVSEEETYSDQQLQSVFGPNLHLGSTRQAKC